LKKLPDILDIGAYRRINIMGVSGGGLPAVVAGLNLQADICVVVGANNPDSPRWFVEGRNLARELLACDNTSKLKTEFVYVFGREEEKDEISAKALAQCDSAFGQ
jgi:hypothetical protein